jgi:hypothetical protein
MVCDVELGIKGMHLDDVPRTYAKLRSRYIL